MGAKVKTISAEEYLAELKKRPTHKQLIARYVEGSNMKVNVSQNWIREKGELELIEVELRIEITGEAARIPALKNRKIPGLNCPNPDTLARIAALDALFYRAVTASEIRTLNLFGSSKVWVVLICGNRNRRFDPDNCFSTIKDWLEPRTKLVGKGRARGWGIGVIEDDSQIAGLAVRAADVGLDTKDTTIVIKPFSTRNLKTLTGS